MPDTIYKFMRAARSTVQKHFSSSSPVTHQCSTAEQYHEDDEGLKPVVLHYPVAGLSKCPPHLPPAHIYIYLTTLELLHTA